jgi:hypothetical protein
VVDPPPIYRAACAPRGESRADSCALANAALNCEITREMADADARTAWNKGDFFGTKFGKK